MNGFFTRFPLPASAGLRRALLVGAGALVATVCLQAQPGAGFLNSQESPLKGEQSGLAQIQDGFRKVYELYNNRVVFISTTQTVETPQNPFFNDPMLRRFFNIPDQPGQQQRQGLGSGFVLSADGYICTNHHVVAEADEVTVKLGEDEFKAKVVGSDQLTDLALLKIDGADGLEPVFWGDSDQIRVGDWAIAIGSPFGLDKTFTTGVISAEPRENLDPLGNTFIQTDASINPGNSGGPLLNISGEVIGVNRMIYSRSGGNIGIGFAIPANTARAVLEQLKEKGRVVRGYIGVQIAPMNAAIASKLGRENAKGALVARVQQGAPADKAGLQPRDVIEAVNGQEIENFFDLKRSIIDLEIGDSANLRVWRDGKTFTTELTVIEQPE